MTTELNSKVKAKFSAAAILQQVWRESFVSHLPNSTHSSVKHALLSTPSTSALFDEEVILHLLIQVRDDSQLSLLKNLFSLKGGKQLASVASSSGPRRHVSSSSSLPPGAFREVLEDPNSLLRLCPGVGRRLPLKAF